MVAPERNLRTAIAISLVVHGLIVFAVSLRAPEAENVFRGLDVRLVPPPTRAVAPAPQTPVAASFQSPRVSTVSRPARPVVPAAPVAISAEQRVVRGPAETDVARGQPLVASSAQSTAGSMAHPLTPSGEAREDQGRQAGTGPSPAATEAAPGAGRTADTDAVRAYRLAVASKARGFKRYPANALAAGWAGTAEVRISIAPGGRPQNVNLERSSGYEALDRAAVAMIEAGMVRAPIPEPLLGRAFAVTLPVVFEPDLR